MELRRRGHIVPATVLEFRLLKFFLNNPEQAFSREQLMHAVWPARERKSARTVDNSILHLRRKLEENPNSPTHFQTVRGIGYKFVVSSVNSGTPNSGNSGTPKRPRNVK